MPSCRKLHDFIRNIGNTDQDFHCFGRFSAICKRIQRDYAVYCDPPAPDHSVFGLAEVHLVRRLTLNDDAFACLDSEQQFMRELFNRTQMLYLKVRRFWTLAEPILFVREMQNAPEADGLRSNTRSFLLNSIFVNNLGNKVIKDDGRTFLELLHSLGIHVIPQRAVGTVKPLAVLVAHGKWHDISTNITRNSNLLPEFGIHERINRVEHMAGAVPQPFDLTDPCELHGLSYRVREIAGMVDNPSEDLQTLLQMIVSRLDATVDSLDNIALGYHCKEQGVWGGTAGVRYAPLYLVRMMLAARRLKNKNALRETLKHMLHAIYPERLVQHFILMLESGTIEIPSDSVLSQFQFVVDEALMVVWRKRYHRRETSQTLESLFSIFCVFFVVFFVFVFVFFWRLFFGFLW